VNAQEADALGVSLGSFGDTFTAEEAAELMGVTQDSSDDQTASSGQDTGNIRD
jgi:hypothetical protein